MSSNGVTLRFTTLPGQTYTLEYQDELGSDTWVPLQEINAGPTVATVDLTDPASSRSSRFYRLRRSQ